jgi:hypothetical protein
MLDPQIPQLKIREILGVQGKLRTWRLSTEDEKMFKCEVEVCCLLSRMGLSFRELEQVYQEPTSRILV